MPNEKTTAQLCVLWAAVTTTKSGNLLALRSSQRYGKDGRVSIVLVLSLKIPKFSLSNPI